MRPAANTKESSPSQKSFKPKSDKQFEDTKESLRGNIMEFAQEAVKKREELKQQEEEVSDEEVNAEDEEESGSEEKSSSSSTTAES
ncbi:unnamed protein product, partial [Strongylus vulgaris]